MALARPTQRVSASDIEARASRYRRVAAMRGEGLTFEEIGSLIGRSGERARQIFEAGPPRPADGTEVLDMPTAAELELLVRQAQLRERIDTLTAAWRATRHRLREVEEELEARRVDRILGLA